MMKTMFVSTCLVLVSVQPVAAQEQAKPPAVSEETQAARAAPAADDAKSTSDDSAASAAKPDQPAQPSSVVEAQAAPAASSKLVASDAAPKPTMEKEQDSAADAAKEANNPLSNLTSISFQDYKTLEISQDTDETRGQAVSNVMYARFAKSFGKRVILRVSLPLVSTYNEGKSGLGDMNIILPILLNNEKSPLKFGVGPLANLRTHTDDGLGADAWGIGLSATAFYMKNPVFQPGALITWSYNVAAKTPADKGNMLVFQPFLFFQLGHGTYLRSSALPTFEFEHSRYNVPVGLGIGQVLKQKRTVFNIYAEGQQTVWSYGALLPTSQLFFGLNVQILPKG